MIKVLFVCLGNICRSPMAEGLFIHLIEEKGLSDHFEVDSCGTSGWHVGEAADSRMRQTAGAHGVHLPSRSRQIRHSDFRRFDYIIPMDESNLRDLEEIQAGVEGARAELVKMRHFDPQDPDGNVPDPYYGGQRGFEDVYEMLLRTNENFIEYLVEKHQLPA